MALSGKQECTVHRHLAKLPPRVQPAQAPGAGILWMRSVRCDGARSRPCTALTLPRETEGLVQGHRQSSDTSSETHPINSVWSPPLRGGLARKIPCRQACSERSQSLPFAVQGREGPRRHDSPCAIGWRTWICFVDRHAGCFAGRWAQKIRVEFGDSVIPVPESYRRMKCC